MVVAQNSLRDVKIAQLVRTWLSVVTLHVDYQRCCEAAKVGLERGNDLVSFPCSKFWHYFVTLLSVLGSCRLNMAVQYVSTIGPSTHLCSGILSVLGCQLRNFILFVQKFPVDSSTLGVIDHYLGCC